MENRIYLDNAATTPMDPRVVDVMIPFLREKFGNPSSIHAHGREVRTAIERSRKTVADLLGCTPSEIFFTSGGTEADNMILRCAAETGEIEQIISSPLEHHAVLHTAEHLHKLGLIDLQLLEVDTKGVIDQNHLESLLATGKKSLISLMHGNNEIGNLNNLQDIGELAKSYGAHFHSDTVQTMGHYKHDFSTLPVHFAVAAAHKFNGPKGAGFLYMNRKNKLHPLIYGGAQERNMRGGTENVYGIVGLTKALSLAYEDMEGHDKHMRGLKAHMKNRLLEEIPGVQFNGQSGDIDNSLYTVLSVSFPAHEDNDMLLFHLDIHGISASGGSACSSGSLQGSHVLAAIGADPSRASVRFSFGRFNTKEEIDKAVEVVKSLVPTPHSA
jgi:cysteine desulfurase